MTDELKVLLTVDEAVALFKSPVSAHSINVVGGCILGCEWSIEGARHKLGTCSDIQVAGDTARGMGHGIAATEPDGDYIFFEHDEERLAAMIAAKLESAA